jgi:hypothetical protein
MTATTLSARETLPLWRPALAAAIVPGFGWAIVAFVTGSPIEVAIFACIAVTIVAFAHVLVLGLPWVYSMHATGHFRAWSMAIGGFLVGGVPFGLMLTRDFKMTLFFGASGVFGALAFYAVSRLLQRNGRESVSVERMPLR